MDRFVTAEEEAADVVARLGALTGAGPGGTTPSRAVLCRTRAQFGPVLDALDAAGLPYEVLGLSGLLALPEVAEVLAVLHVLADPTRSDQLVRLLTGPRWRIGVADLEVLQERARFVSRLRAGRAAGGREDPAGDAPDVAPVRDVSPERTPTPPPCWRPSTPCPGRGRTGSAPAAAASHPRAWPD
nr:3'-5' exonuclease [Micrococcus luteus]